MPKRKISRKVARERRKKEEQRILGAGKRYTNEQIQEACKLRREGFTMGDIRHFLNEEINKKTLIRWFKDNGLYDKDLL
jgi:hypothetical protein